MAVFESFLPLVRDGVNIIPIADDTYWLGSDTVGFKGIKFPDLKLYQLDADTLSLENIAGGTYKNIKLGGLVSSGGGLLTVPSSAGADTVCLLGATQTLAVKTLTTPIIASLYQASGGGLLTVPASVGADTVCLLDATQTLAAKTLTAPVIKIGRAHV